MKLLHYSSVVLFNFITKVFYVLLIVIKTTWLTCLKVLRVGCAENSNIPPECSDNSNQSNTTGVEVLSEEDEHVNLAAKLAQLSFNTPEVNVSSNVRAEYSQDRNQSNPFEGHLSDNYVYINLPARSVEIISTFPEVNVSSNARAEYSQDRNRSNPFEGHLSDNGAYINLPARSVEIISTLPEVNVSSNARAEYFQNRNQSNTFEAELLSNNGAFFNLPARPVHLFSNVQAVNVSLTENNFDSVSGQSNKMTPADVAKTDGGATNFESRVSSFAVGTSRVEADGEVELMPVSGRKRFKSARPVYKGITNAAAGSSSNQGHEDMPLILTHRKRKFCNPFI